MKKLILAAIIACFVSGAMAATNILPVWNVDEGLLNARGGGYNHFAAEPSSASIHLVADVHRGAAGRSMEIRFRKAETGYCGAWIHLFDETVTPGDDSFLDVSNYPYLSFWIRGAKGGENAVVQIADQRWLAKDDSKPLKSVSDYLGGPVSTNWQEVVVPLHESGVMLSRLAGITWNFMEQGEGAVYIDDISFKSSPDVAVPESAGKDAAHGAVITTTSTLSRAMWVWEAGPVLTDKAVRAELFDFCAEHGVNELFFQILYLVAEEEDATKSCELSKVDELRGFLREADGRGIRVHAMDGYPEYALRRLHDEVLAVVDAIVSYNETAAPEERFYGIHFDNEPYQILGFDGPARQAILAQYLELNERIMAHLKEKGSDLVYGVDIPFWLDEKDMKGAPQGIVTYKGVTKDAAKHIIDIVDNVGIMDYRSFAGGVDGIIYHAMGEIDYADKVGKQTYIGVETFRYEPTPVVFIYGPAESDWMGYQGWALGSTTMLSSAVGGFKVRTFTDGSRRYIGLAESPGMPSQDYYMRTLAALYSLYGATTAGRTADIGELEQRVPKAVRGNPDYRDFETFAWTNKASGEIAAAGFRTTEIMTDKITFAGKTKAEMEAVLREAAEHYRGSPSFRGFAIHHYTTWKAMKDE